MAGSGRGLFYCARETVFRIWKWCRASGDKLCGLRRFIASKM